MDLLEVCIFFERKRKFFYLVWNLLERKIESKLILSRFPNEVIKEEPNLALDMAEMQIDEKENKVFLLFFFKIFKYFVKD